MILYFINGSHQRKLLLESDYVDDLYDMLIGFFEEHGKYPHFLKLERLSDNCEIHFESSSEYFMLEGADDEQVNEFSEFVDEFNQ